MKSSLENLINKSQQKFNELLSYDVTRQTFTGMGKPVDFFCNKHGERFTASTAANHLKSVTGGCPSCKKARRSAISKTHGQQRRKEAKNCAGPKKRKTVKETKEAVGQRKIQVAKAVLVKVAAKGECENCQAKAECPKCRALVNRIVREGFTHHCRWEVKGKMCSAFLKAGEAVCCKHRALYEDQQEGIRRCGKNGCRNPLGLGDQYYCIRCKTEIRRGPSQPRQKCTIVSASGMQCSNRPREGSEWCGKHQRAGQLKRDTAAGIRHCANFIRGCASILAEGDIAKCEICREKERTKDKERREKRKHQQQARSAAKAEELACVKCGKSQPAAEFFSAHGPSTNCQTCREKQKIVDANRPARDRSEWSKEFEQRPERKAAKQEWRKANPEKMEKSSKDYRARKKKEDSQGYLEHQAENQRKWREANPEKWAAIDQRYKNSENYQVSYYKWSAETKGIEWDLSDEQVLNMSMDQCWYCGQPPSEKPNGVDRLNSDGPYNTEKTRACCSQCN